MLDFVLKDKNFKNYKLYLLVVYILWACSLLLYYLLSNYINSGSLINGVKFGNDSTFYLRGAKNIINGDISIFEIKSKFGYLLFLLPFLYFDLPLYNVVLFQIFLTSISAFCLYKISEKYFCKLSGVICTALFLFYFPLQLRNFYILTEILFIDISIILTFLIVYFKKNNIPIIIIFLLLLFSIRPNGSLFFFGIIASIFMYFFLNNKYLYLFFYSIFSIIISYVLFDFFNSYLNELNLIGSLNKGIIWGYSFETNKICRDSCLGTELINNDFANTIHGYFQFVSVNFIQYFKIFFYKIFWMIFRARPYYSDLHNLYILFFNVIIYLPFIYGFIKKPKNSFSLWIINFYILFSIALVGFTFADWSGRFSLYVLPFIMIYSSYGILIFVKKILNVIN